MCIHKPAETKKNVRIIDVTDYESKRLLTKAWWGMTISSGIITKDIVKDFIELGIIEKVKQHHQTLFLANSTVYFTS